MEKTLAIALMLMLSACVSQPPATTSTTTSTTSSSTTTSTTSTTTTLQGFETVSIATWSLEGFEWAGTRTKILDELGKHDIIALQNLSGGQASLLADGLPSHYQISGDEYAFLHSRDVLPLSHYVPNSSIRPFIATFLIGNYTLDILQLRAGKDDAGAEINALLDIRTSNNQIWLGDLNADCGFYDRGRNSRYAWIIPEDADTSVEGECAYDRIITTYPVEDMITGYNVSGLSVSDHHPVFIEMEVPEVDCGNVEFTFEMGNLTEPPFTSNGRERSCSWELSQTLKTWKNHVGENDEIDLDKRSCSFRAGKVNEHGDPLEEGWSITCAFDCCEFRERYRNG